MADLVFYGRYNFQNGNTIVDRAGEFRGLRRDVLRLANSRSAGSTPVGQEIREKVVGIEGVIKSTATKSLEGSINEMMGYVAEENRFLRISREWQYIYQPTSSEGWLLVGDGVNKDYTEETEIFGGTVLFDADVSVAADNYAGISIIDNSTINLGDHNGEGHFEWGVYLPTLTDITSLSIDVGSDTSNYLSGTVFKQYDDNDLQMGWNWLSIDWQDMVQTGVVDPYSFGRFVTVKVNYEATMVDTTGFGFGGIIWQNDDETRNYRCLAGSVSLENEHYNIDFARFGVEFVAYDGVSVSTGQDTLYVENGITAAVKSVTVTTDGSYDPEMYLSLAITKETNTDTITIQNLTTGDSITMDETWAAGQLIELDTYAETVLLNKVQIDYASVFPRFVVGENRLAFTIAAAGQDTETQATNNSNLSGEI